MGWAVSITIMAFMHLGFTKLVIYLEEIHIQESQMR